MDMRIPGSAHSFRKELLPLMFLCPLVFTGCVNIPVSQQQDLSRPNMVFESQGAFASRPALFGQTEPGSAASSGGQSAGCTACR
jgi:hypothetical protein